MNPETREMSLADNQNVYEYNPQNGKTKYSYFYNTDDHTAVAGIGADRKTVFLFRAWNGGDVYSTAGLSGKEKYNHFKRIPFPVNTDISQEQSATTWDKWLVFSSDRQGGSGGFDLYYGMPDEKLKIYGALTPDSVNTSADETDVRFLEDGTLIFSSNRDGKFKPYYTRFDGSKWNAPALISFIPDSFASSDVRDLVIYDSLFYFSSNKTGNYDIYWSVIVRDSVPATKPDTIIAEVIDSVPVQPDTALSEFEQKMVDLEQKLDSLEFKPYRAFVQVGAYRFVKTIIEFKHRFPAFDTTALRIESEILKISPPDSVRKFMIDKTYLTLREAALRQQVALKQQADKINLYESPVDAFIAVYDARNVRIVIFFNLDKKEYKILVGDDVVYF
ncbi:hypothetical protein SDC9_93183 [bioreactor metagenome]|uniref:Uncharacterized protein n=1 Tax=bioreactor metagenome TaxID=1076179 RepID=A0A644ZZS7_9ZZZZ